LKAELKEAREVKEIEEVREQARGVAAFFDLDGTLIALPSMERRFFWALRRGGLVPLRNYFLWVAEAVRLSRQGIGWMMQANKMYLRGLNSFAVGDAGLSDDFSSTGTAYDREEGKQISIRQQNHAQVPVPGFFEQGLQRIQWHARQGHKIFLVSGTLEPLASAAALALTVRLAVRGVNTKIGVCATCIEQIEGRWTGRIVGDAMFGEAKARAVRKIAQETRCDLERCYAYGDSVNDRWMLAAVGRATAVNPSKELTQVAELHGWPVMRWDEKKLKTRRRREEKKANERTGIETRTIGSERAEGMESLG
jgi:HAD superfamily hydrolase (TIGR01490 family)